MSPGTSPGTHTFWPLRGIIFGTFETATPTKMARRTPQWYCKWQPCIACKAFFAFPCFTVAWVVAIVGNDDETRSECWGRLSENASRAIPLSPLAHVNDEGPFTLTQPIHTHYYTPRDHNDGRNKRIWFNSDGEQPCCRVSAVSTWIAPCPRRRLLLMLFAVALAIMANVSTSRPQRPHMYDYIGLVLPFSPFSPLSGPKYTRSNTIRRWRIQQTTKLLKTHTSRLTVDNFFFGKSLSGSISTFFCHKTSALPPGNVLLETAITLFFS